MASREILQERLQEAEEAYHLLQCGQKEVTVSYDGKNSVTYNQISAAQLQLYISDLRVQINKGGARKSIIPRF